MKKINFIKMVGAGNDFIIVDVKKGLNVKRLARLMCHRTNGIGADGLLIFDKSKKADYRMRIINADGSEAEMCGNGARCMAAYIARHKMSKKKMFTIETIAGNISATISGNLFSVRLSDPLGYKSGISLMIHGRKIHANYIDTGVPHVVVFVDGIEDINVSKIGRMIRIHKKFQPRGVNVNFVEQINKSLVRVRTYERGVEDETLACGTGSVAVAIVTYLQSNPTVQNKRNARMKIRTASKEVLEIIFDIQEGNIFNVWLKGSAKFIASGEFFI